MSPARRSRLLIPLLALALLGCSSSRNASPRVDRLINNDWRFVRRDVGGGGHSIALNDSDWERVSVPHTWNALDGQDGGGDYYRGPGWYRRRLSIDSKDAGKSVFLRFEAAATVADVYVNGQLVGQHRGNFGAFCFDVTDAVHVGSDNVLAVRVDNSKFDDVAPLSGDFTIFGGIYRNVHLLVLPTLSISPTDDASSGVYLKTLGHDKGAAGVQAVVKLRNASNAAKNAAVTCTVRDAAGNVVTTQTVSREVAAGSTGDAAVMLAITDPHLWNGLSDPYLYSVDTEVRDGTTLVDRVTQPLGIRSFDVNSSIGFILNGRPYRLHGVNKHQDRIGKGWAISRRDLDEDYTFVKELGATCIRLAHYQHSADEYDVCDKLGIVVWAELAFVNETGSMPQFGDNLKQQLRELIKQNFNHPSICFWSLYNELSYGKGQTEERPEQTQLVRELNTLAKELDPSRPTTAGTNLKAAHVANWVTDVVAFNRYFGWYGGSPDQWGEELDKLHEAYPLRCIGVSEYGAGASIAQHEANPTTRPNTKGPWHPEVWQSIVHEKAWAAMAQRQWLWGTFLWNMFDFASDGRGEGDTMGRNDKGLVTYDRRVKKDAFYFYKANWSSEGVLHVTSRRFNPRPAGRIEVKVYSNCGTVDLAVDGKKQETRSPLGGIARWQIDLPAGTHKIDVTGQRSGQAFTDSVVWELQSP